MDLIPYLSTVILIATIATIILAFLSYLVFKLRDRKKRSRGDEAAPVFFRRYLPDEPEAEDSP